MHYRGMFDPPEINYVHMLDRCKNPAPLKLMSSYAVALKSSNTHVGE